MKLREAVDDVTRILAALSHCCLNHHNVFLVTKMAANLHVYFTYLMPLCSNKKLFLMQTIPLAHMLLSLLSMLSLTKRLSKTSPGSTAAGLTRKQQLRPVARTLVCTCTNSRHYLERRTRLKILISDWK